MDMQQPWLDGKIWSRRVRSSARAGMIGAWVFAGFWNLISVPLLFVLPPEVAKGNYAALIGFLFPVVGAGLLWWAVKATRQWRKFGVTELTLDPFPGAIGGDVGGSLDLPLTLDRDQSFVVTLECVRSYVSGSGKNRSRKQSVEWQARGPAQVELGASGVVLRFRFEVPAGLPQSEKKSGRNYHLWRVNIAGSEAAMPFDRTFEIGVFATGERSTMQTIDTNGAGQAAATELLDDALLDARKAQQLRKSLGLTLDVRADWLRLFFHYGRYKLVSAMLLVIGGAFAAVGLFLPEQGFDGWMIRGVFGLFGFGMLAGALYLPANSLDVRVGAERLTRERRWFGVRTRHQEIRPAQIHELTITKGGSTTKGGKTEIDYRLVAKGEFGEFRIAEGISDKPLLDALRNKVMGFAGLETH